MPMPKPSSDESQSDFMGRCMSHEMMMEEFPEHDQRVAVCMTQWRRHEEEGKMGAIQLELEPAASGVKARYAHVKTSRAVEIKDVEKGIVEIVFATLEAKDLDDDWTLPGAFPDELVTVSAYGHASWGGGMDGLPVATAQMFNTGKEARASLQFFMDTTPGMETFRTMKNLGALGQYSYGYDVLELGELTPELRSIGVSRVLKTLKVHEISPVLRGAGVGTRTVSAKQSKAITDADDAKLKDQALKELARFEQTRARLLFHYEPERTGT